MKRVIILLLAPALLAQDPSADQVPAPRPRGRLGCCKKGVTGFYKSQDCFSCHHTALPNLALALARERGIPVDEAAALASLVKGLARTPDLSSIDRIVQDNMIVDPAVNEALALITAHAAGLQPSLTTAIQARLIANAQRADGHWVTMDERPPQSHSQFTATAQAVRAMQFYIPEELRQEAAARAGRAKAWLLRAAPETTEDFTYRLTGLAWTGASAAELAGAARDLRGLQRPDGGWAQLRSMQPDAYATKVKRWPRSTRRAACRLPTPPGARDCNT